MKSKWVSPQGPLEGSHLRRHGEVSGCGVSGTVQVGVLTRRSPGRLLADPDLEQRGLGPGVEQHPWADAEQGDLGSDGAGTRVRKWTMGARWGITCPGGGGRWSHVRQAVTVVAMRKVAMRSRLGLTRTCKLRWTVAGS